MRAYRGSREAGRAEPVRGPERGEVRGRITIVQEDRIRVVDPLGRGYLFVVKAGVCPPDRLERWRDDATPLRVRYRGLPDAGAVAERIEPDRVC